MKDKLTALITGATGGLGRHLCIQFAKGGCDLVITARDPAKLRELAGHLRSCYRVGVKAIPLDLNQSDAPKLLYQKTRAAGIQVDILVNNAGFGLGGAFAENTPRVQNAMVRVNALAPTRLCRMYLPGMIRRGRGGILNICSTGSFVAGPNNAVYCATKAYLLSLTEALAHEVRGKPVTVTAVCPGAIHTGFARRAGMETTPLFSYRVMEPAQVARRAYLAFVAGQPLTVIGLVNRAVIAAIRLLPRQTAVRLSGLIQKQLNVGSRGR